VYCKTECESVVDPIVGRQTGAVCEEKASCTRSFFVAVVGV